MVLKIERCGLRTGNSFKPFVLRNLFNRHGVILKQCTERSWGKQEELADTIGNYFNDGNLELCTLWSPSGLCYSLNKRKRWEIPNIIKDVIRFVKNEDFRLTLYERTYLDSQYTDATNANLGSWCDCIGYQDSKGKRYVSPNGHKSFLTDLRNASIHDEQRRKPSRLRVGHNKHFRDVQRKQTFKRDEEEKTVPYATAWEVMTGHDNDKDIPEVRYQVCYPLEPTSRIKVCEGSNFFTREKKTWSRLVDTRRSLYKVKGRNRPSSVLYVKNYYPEEILDISQNYHRYYDNNHYYEIENHKGSGICCCFGNDTYSYHECWCDFNEDKSVPDVKRERTVDVKLFDCIKNKTKFKSKKRLKKNSRSYYHPNSASSNNPTFYGKDKVIYETGQNDDEQKETSHRETSDSESSDSDSEMSIPDLESEKSTTPTPSDMPVATINDNSLSISCSIYLDSINEVLKKEEMVMTGKCQPPRFLIFLYEQTELRGPSLIENYTRPSIMIQESLNSFDDRPDQHKGHFFVQLHGLEDSFLDKANVLFLKLLKQGDLLVFRLNEVTQIAREAITLQGATVQRDILTHPVRHSRQSSQLTFMNKYNSRYVVKSVNEAYRQVISTKDVGVEKEKLPQIPTDGFEKKLLDGDYCNICFVSPDGQTEGTAILPCQHFTCNECLSNYCTEKIKQGALNIECCEYKCHSKIDEVTIMSLITPRLFRRWMRRKQEVAIERSGRWKWCPNASCQRVAAATYQGGEDPGVFSIPVRCICGKDWCLDCQGSAHWPLTCGQADVYHKMLKQNGDFGMFKPDKICYVQVKKCPMCQHPIEKGGGCQHMMCRCGHGFCWECLHPWSEHVTFLNMRCKGHVNEMEIELSNTRVFSSPIKFYLKSIEHRKKWMQLKDDVIQAYTKPLSVRLGVLKTFNWKKKEEMDPAKIRENIDEIVELLLFIREAHQTMEHIYMVMSNGTKKMQATRYPMMLLADYINFALTQLLEMLRTDCTLGICDKHRNMKLKITKSLGNLMAQTVMLQKMIARRQSRHSVLDNPDTEVIRYK